MLVVETDAGHEILFDLQRRFRGALDQAAAAALEFLAQAVHMQAQFLQEHVGTIRLQRQSGPAVDVVHHFAQAGDTGEIDGVGTAADGGLGERIDARGHRGAAGQVVADAGLGHHVLGSGGAIIAWEDRRNGSTDPDIYAQRVHRDGLHGELRVRRHRRVDGELVVNPDLADRQKADINLIIAGTREAITMVEGGAQEASEAEILEALQFAHEKIQPVIDIQAELVAKIGSVLSAHNRREEEPGGAYDACDATLGSAAEALLEELRAFPEVPLKPYNDGPEVMKHIETTLELSRRQWEG